MNIKNNDFCKMYNTRSKYNELNCRKKKSGSFINNQAVFIVGGEIYSPRLFYLNGTFRLFVMRIKGDKIIVK